MSKLSIIIPVYNVEKYLPKCLKSVIDQTYKNLEIILINDGSTDQSYKICKQYSKLDNRIKLINQKNQGVSATRNIGIELATGEYIMFVDSDDWLEKDACNSLIKKIKSTNSDIIFYNFYNEYKNKTIKNYEFTINKENNVKKIQALMLAPEMKIIDSKMFGLGFTWNKIIRASIIKENNIKFPLANDKAIFEDVLFYYTLLENTNKIIFFNKYLYHYRFLKNSATRGYNHKIIEINKKIYSYIMSFYDAHKEDDYFNDSLNARMINLFCVSLNTFICNKDNKINFLQRRKLIIKEKNKDYYLKAIKKAKFKNLSKKQKIYLSLLKLNMNIFVIFLNYLEQFIKNKR